MGYVIAIAGKGGTGKTTIAGIMVRLIKEKKMGSLLAVDADPNSNLAEILGLEVKESIGKILDEISQNPENITSGMSKDRFIDYKMQMAIQEADGFDILTMGRPEGPGCYCYVNNVLRNVIGKLIGKYNYVVMDNEAGFEHLSRRTMRSADVLVMVSDATKVGLISAKRISELSQELEIKIKKRLLIINRQDEGVDEQYIKNLGLEYIGKIPQDPQLERLTLNNSSLLDLNADAASITALRKLVDRILL